MHDSGTIHARIVPEFFSFSYTISVLRTTSYSAQTEGTNGPVPVYFWAYARCFAEGILYVGPYGRAYVQFAKGYVPW